MQHPSRPELSPKSFTGRVRAFAGESKLRFSKGRFGCRTGISAELSPTGGFLEQFAALSTKIVSAQPSAVLTWIKTDVIARVSLEQSRPRACFASH